MSETKKTPTLRHQNKQTGQKAKCGRDQKQSHVCRLRAQFGPLCIWVPGEQGWVSAARAAWPQGMGLQLALGVLGSQRASGTPAKQGVGSCNPRNLVLQWLKLPECLSFIQICGGQKAKLDTEAPSHALTRCNQALQKQVHCAGSVVTLAQHRGNFCVCRGCRHWGEAQGHQGSWTQAHEGPELCPTFLGREEMKKGKYHPQTGFSPAWASQWCPVAASVSEQTWIDAGTGQPLFSPTGSGL